ELGHEVVGEASNGNEAVELDCTTRPDVELMDIEMPGMDGIEASKAIQQRCPAPIVILTAYESGDLIERTSSAGAGAYLVKPANLSEIGRAITIAVARHGDLMRLQDALMKEKMLTREVYHRVKNNMATIVSLLHLQGKASHDEKIIAALRDSENRVRAMSSIHETLYMSNDICNVELGDYLKRIATSLHSGFVSDHDRVGLEVDADRVSVHSEVAISCGLIANELLTNAAKHAFPKDRKGTIGLVLRELDGNRILLSINDNGIGLPDKFEVGSTDSLGMEIVSVLVDQIGGELEIDPSNGAAFKITFSQGGAPDEEED
ncbi:MAG: histidine kinase dimerization/phosphoacceptor domain -containing protein, partial [Thermodesulfovibrionales bacterium]